MKEEWLKLPSQYIKPFFEMMRENNRLKNLTIIGNSMAPTFLKGGVVEVDNNYKEITINDIIVFINNNHLTVHRVIDMQFDSNNEKIYITKGDAKHIRKTETVVASDVIGKVINYIGPSS